MRRAGSTIVIERPIDEVFAYVSDQTKTTSWCLGMTECRLTSEKGMTRGATRHVEVKTALGRMSWDFELIRAETDSILVWQDVGAVVPMIDTYTFEALGQKTLFGHYNEYTRAPFPMSTLMPLLLIKGNRTIRADNAALKRLLEAM